MTTFDDRKKAFEDKFAHDEELRFKMTVRAAKLFGAWVIEKAGLDKDYAQTLFNLATSGKSESAIVKKVEEDVKAKGQNLSHDALLEKFQQCVNQAKSDLLKA